MKKIRLDKLMVERGLAESPDRARSLIMARSVLVGGMVQAKAGTQVAGDAVVELKQAAHSFVSRGALKLEKGLDEFNIDPTGWTAIDVGSSTGGFTDVLLSRGAAKVFAVDVGYGQLDWKLRQDSRVVVLERENIRYLAADKVPEPCDIAVIDVSFISLTLVFPKVVELLGPDKPIVALIKPQFEASRDEVGRGGVVRDPEIRQKCVERIQTFAHSQGMEVGAVTESPIKGPKGNVEFLQLLVTPR